MIISKKNSIGKMIRFCLLALLLPVVETAHTQVTIGSVDKPSKGALLDLVANDKGVLFPKVALSKFDELSPLIDPATAGDKSHSIGMVVYNTNEHADGIALGFVVWNGQEWQSMAGGGASMSKVSTIDCDGIEIKGSYLKGKSLDAVANKIILPITVDRKGSYNILVEVYQGADHNLSNGYTFASDGEFHSTGAMSVTLTGQGSPIAPTDNVNLDFLKIYLNGQEITCTQGSIPGIQVDNIQPDYSFKCENVDLDMPVASCVPNHAMGAADYISVRITAPIDAAGAYYHLHTNTINGVSFDGSGLLTGGTQNVLLYGSGTILKAGTYTYTLTANNVSNQTCTINMSVTYNKTIKIKTFSEDSNYGLIGSQRAPALIAKNSEIFGLGINENAVLSIASNCLTVTGSNSHPGATEDYNDVALVLLGYERWFEHPQARAHFFNDYIKQGGVAFICCENNSNLQTMINDFSDKGAAVYYSSFQNDLIPMVGNSPVVRGFYDLKGKSISRNGGGQQDISTFSADWEMVAGTSSNNARIIKHKLYDLYIGSDGGLLSGSASNDPARVDAQGRPQISGNNDSTAGGSNSYVLANVMIYAIQKYINKHQ